MGLARLHAPLHQRQLLSPMFKAVFTFALPMLLVSNVPARLLADKLNSPAQVVLLLVMSVVCFCVSEWGWRASMRRYTSASS